MKESDYYPAGAYSDPSAPYNQEEVPEREFDVCISQSLSKNTSIYTQDYQPELDEENGHVYADTSQTDWKKAYTDVALTPLEIINSAEKIAKALLEEGKTKFAGVYLKDFVEECQDWNDNELEVVEE